MMKKITMGTLQHAYKQISSLASRTYIVSTIIMMGYLVMAWQMRIKLHCAPKGGNAAKTLS
jgi:hypothetical protein